MRPLLRLLRKMNPLGRTPESHRYRSQTLRSGQRSDRRLL